MEGKSARVDEWMQMLRNNRDACIDTLEDEKMYVEAIFREKKDGRDYLYWFDVQGEGGIHVAQSEHEIDKKHMAFWKECIEPDSKTEFPLELFLEAKKLDLERL